MTRVFFDTEFTELGIDPRLISIGLVSEDGRREFYAELADTYQPKDCGDFAREAVLPLLQGDAVCLTWAELGRRLGAWLEAFGEPVKLTTDSMAWDWPWIQEVFGDLDTWPANVDGKPEILGQSAEFCQAVEDAFAAGLRRHHALDDAKANRIGWLASRGNVPSV
ncbi:hypothetical protein [Azonexus sp. IMCC34839]|uniref:hypothetical protein n=1 Tax=Azonexus sp. IMCC34839 TaxID=3133695 RepID=UPI003999C677